MKSGSAIDPEAAVPVPPALAHLRRFPLDGALLLFDRDTGLHALCDGPETAHLRQRAPRVVQFAITNACNLTCGFCSRDLDERSLWSADDAFEVLAGLARAGTLEVAFGGGEPLAFRGFTGLVRRLHDETPLAVGLTTNGLLLTRERLREMSGCVGQIRLSLYDDNRWEEAAALLAEEGMRFGINWLVTPERLPALEATVLRAAALGAGDALLLSYNGPEQGLHLAPAQDQALGRRVAALSRGLAGRCPIKLSVCFGARLAAAPRLFPIGDCGAGRDFVVLTSDRALSPCSFHGERIPVRSAEDVLDAWRRERVALGEAAGIAGCARPAVSAQGDLRRRLPLG